VHMRKALSRHAPTLLIGALAIVLATTLSATAALVVTSKNIKNGTIKNKDLHANTITSGKIKNGTLADQDLSAELLASLQGAGGAAGSTGSTGPAGPPGPQGAKGDQGEKGDKGDEGDPGTSGYQVVSMTSPTGAAGEIRFVSTTCPAGKKVVGGGGGTAFADGTVEYSAPKPDSSGWTVRAKLGPGTTQEFPSPFGPPIVITTPDSATVYAICMTVG
jgi:hypothetical protein